MREKVVALVPRSKAARLELQRIDWQLAARRAKLMKELRERISEVERRVAKFNSGRAALWGQVEAAFSARMLARSGRMIELFI